MKKHRVNLPDKWMRKTTKSRYRTWSQPKKRGKNA